MALSSVSLSLSAFCPSFTKTLVAGLEPILKVGWNLILRSLVTFIFEDLIPDKPHFVDAGDCEFHRAVFDLLHLSVL